MSNAARIIHVESESELGRLLEEVEEREAFIEKDGVRYRLSRVDTAGTASQDARLQPERVLDIIGIGESSEGSNIARYKDQYVADATDHRRG